MMADPAPGEDGIGPLLGRLIDDTRQLARAEIALLRARIAFRFGEARTGLLLAVAALLIAQTALGGLVVGLILIVAAALGPLWATLIVIGTALALAALLGWIAIGKLSRAFGDKPGNKDLAP